MAEGDFDDRAEATSAQDAPLHLLGRVERLAYRVLGWLNGPGARLARFWYLKVLFPLLWVFLGRRLVVRGAERLLRLPPSASFLLVSNHRTFFDQFVLAWILVGRQGLRHRVLFPVRANFFYENPLGLLICLLLSAGAMFPPVFRSAKKRAFNQHVLDLLSARLHEPGNMVGFHPEGTRNKGPDPYALLPAQPGAGKLVLQARPAVVPAFVTGLTNSLGKELWDNLRGRRPVVVVFGEPIDPAVWPEGNRLALQKKVADELLARIALLMEEEKELRRAATEAPRRDRAG